MAATRTDRRPRFHVGRPGRPVGMQVDGRGRPRTARRRFFFSSHKGMVSKPHLLNSSLTRAGVGMVAKLGHSPWGPAGLRHV